MFFIIVKLISLKTIHLNQEIIGKKKFNIAQINESFFVYPIIEVKKLKIK